MLDKQVWFLKAPQHNLQNLKDLSWCQTPQNTFRGLMESPPPWVRTCLQQMGAKSVLVTRVKTDRYGFNHSENIKLQSSVSSVFCPIQVSNFFQVRVKPHSNPILFEHCLKASKHMQFPSMSKTHTHTQNKLACISLYVVRTIVHTS